MADKSQEERNKELLLQSMDILRGKAGPELAAEIYTADYDDHSGAPQRGPERVLTVREAARTAFPDLDYEIEAVIAEGDLVSWRMVMTGTHKGPLPGSGLPGTGKPIRVRQHHMVRFQHGKIAEHWAIRDDLGMMQQLGVIPGPGGPGRPGGPGGPAGPPGSR